MSGGIDMFGEPPKVQRDYCFNQGIDRLARSVGGWPGSATVHTMSVIGKGDDPQVMLEGSIPTGHSPRGIPTFKGAAERFQAVVRISEYRDAFRATNPQTGEG